MLSTKDDSRRPIPTNIPPRVLTALHPNFLHSELLRGENTKVRPNEIEATHAGEKRNDYLELVNTISVSLSIIVRFFRFCT